MSGTQKPLPGADSQHFLAISYPLDWEKTRFVYLVDLVHLVSFIQPKTRQTKQTKQTK